jgi:hypothetical protein
MHTLPNRTRSRSGAALLALACALTAAVPAAAAAPSIADLDATARAAGNRLDVATRIGQSVFTQEWPAEVSQISANEVRGHLIVGIRLWGVKFHRPVTRDEFVAEIAAVVEKAFAAAPLAEEIDVWASVPIATGRGIVVSGDLAVPTVRTVFSLSTRRGDAPDKIAARADAVRAEGVFWDPQWADQAFEKPKP